MTEKFKSLGLMSGTSGDGVDASLIISNGKDNYESIKDKFYEYDNKTYSNIHALKEKINNKKDLKKLGKEISELEREITLFHAKIIKDFKNQTTEFIVGFHGQTIYLSLIHI